MSTQARAQIVASLPVFSLAGAPQEETTCVFASHREPWEAYAEADDIFIGTIVRLEDAPVLQETATRLTVGHLRLTRIDVIEQLVGEKPSSDDGADRSRLFLSCVCGEGLVEGRTYLIFAARIREEAIAVGPPLVSRSAATRA